MDAIFNEAIRPATPEPRAYPRSCTALDRATPHAKGDDVHWSFDPVADKLNRRLQRRRRLLAFLETL